MPHETMTPRERWAAVLGRQTPDRVPMDYWATEETSALLRKRLGCRTIRQALKKLHVDFVVKAAPDYVGPRLKPRTDVFGCRFRMVDYGTGAYEECIGHPLAGFKSADEIGRHYGWPDPDWWDYRGLKRWVRGKEMYPVRGGGSEPFLTYKYLRGQEQAFIDLVENPEIVRLCLSKLFDLAYVNAVRITEQLPGLVMLSYIAEDLGGQTGLMFSPAHIREFLLPGMKRMIGLARQAGAHVFHHDDGNCRPIIPDMIDAGIDILNPIQWRVPGMEREGLKADFGDKLIFHGGVDNQHTLPFGTVEDVRREVIDNLDILGRGGGYILAPCHNIQSLTPVENIIAMYETGYECGRR
jgi:uroporphyrinogen decarboxylase